MEFGGKDPGMGFGEGRMETRRRGVQRPAATFPNQTPMSFPSRLLYSTIQYSTVQTKTSKSSELCFLISPLHHPFHHDPLYMISILIIRIELPKTAASLSQQWIVCSPQRPEMLCFLTQFGCFASSRYLKELTRLSPTSIAQTQPSPQPPPTPKTAPTKQTSTPSSPFSSPTPTTRPMDFTTILSAPAPDIVYGLFLCRGGLFLCRGDLTVAACRDCITYASTDVIKQCPSSKQAMIWYDECILRYSNASIFAVQETREWIILVNPQNVTNATRLSEALGQVMNDTAARASSDDSGKKFATGVANFSSVQLVYGLAQCTPDLTNSDCDSCLRNSISKFPYQYRGARVYFPNCFVRGELYPFYDLSAGAAPVRGKFGFLISCLID